MHISWVSRYCEHFLSVRSAFKLFPAERQSCKHKSGGHHLLKTPVQKRPGEAGQAALLVVLALGIFLLGALGLALDVSQLYAQRQMAQSAADAAVTSATLSIFHGTNSTSGSPFATGSSPSSFTCTTSDGKTQCVYARANGFGGSTADVVAVSFPTSVSGVTLATGTAPALSVRVQRTVNTTFLQLLGPSTANIAASAIAAMVKMPLSNCITVLNSSASGAFSITGNANLSIPTCGIAVDSNSSSAFTLTGNISVQASAIQLVGNDSPAGNIVINPTPTTHVSSISDPFASVPAPSYNPSVCTFTNLSYTGNQTVNLTQGTYCGGISFTGNVNATFAAGTYVLLGGGLSASGNVNLSGSNVTFYNTFNASHAYAPVSLTGNLNLNLSATTSGPLAGMLFYQDRNAPVKTESFVGNASSNLVGAIYFPNGQLSYVGNSSASVQNVVLVADKLSLTGNASLKVDPTQAGAAQQIKVALVQ